MAGRLPVRNKNVPAVIAVCRLRAHLAGKPAIELAHIINIVFHKLLVSSLLGHLQPVSITQGQEKALI